MKRGGANRRLEALVRKESQESIVSSASSSPKSNDFGFNHHQQQQQFQPWTDKYKPTSLDNLFVHKKRVEEVNGWVLEKASKKLSSICLLTGPPGSGKTATIALVAANNGFTIKEWINPMNLTEFNSNLEFNRDRDEIQGRNQLDLFSDFLLRSSQYSALPLKGVSKEQAGNGKKIILVEDFPNTFYRQHSVFHQLLKNYKQIGGCPLIFIIADAASGDGSLNKLFPQALQTELGIQQFSFNPVAPSYIVKFLTTITTQESLDMDKGLLEDIAVASSGDIRWAVNHYQFKMQQIKQPLFRKPTTRAKRPKLAKGAKGKDSTSVAKGDEKEETLFLFRALGKVLYSKRDTTVESQSESQLKGPLESMKRKHPLQEIPEAIGDKMEVSPETFFHFLHHNHTPFFSKMEDLAAASGFLADSALIFSQWTFDDQSARNFKNRDTREELGLSIAIRGLMHSNSDRVASSWRPLRKPMISEVNASIQKLTDNSRFLFSSESPLIQSFYPQELPFYPQLPPKNFRADQLAFLRDVKVSGKLGQVKKFGLSMLNEKDAVDGEEEDDVEKENSTNSKIASQDKGKVNPVSVSGPLLPEESEEEEFAIEDYDD